MQDLSLNMSIFQLSRIVNRFSFHRKINDTPHSFAVNMTYGVFKIYVANLWNLYMSLSNG